MNNKIQDFRDPHNYEREAELRHDLRLIFDSLTKQQQRIIFLLESGRSYSWIGKHIGIHKQLVYEEIKKIRKQIDESGLGLRKYKYEKYLIDFTKAKSQDIVRGQIDEDVSKWIVLISALGLRITRPLAPEDLNGACRVVGTVPKRTRKDVAAYKYDKIVSDPKRKWRVKISKEDFVKWYASEPDECYYCGKSGRELLGDRSALLKRYPGDMVEPRDLSVDRTDNSRGYEAGNMVLACMSCNARKGKDKSQLRQKEYATFHKRQNVSRVFK